MTNLRETVSQAIDEALVSIDLDYDDLNEWERGVITDAAIAAMQPTLGRNINAELLDQQQAIQERIAELERQRDAALVALKVARRTLAFQPHPLTASAAEDKRQTLAQIDAILEGEGR